MKRIILFSLLTVTLIFGSCTSTRIISSWREPDKQVAVNQLNKVLVVAMFNNETNRHRAEDRMARGLYLIIISRITLIRIMKKRYGIRSKQTDLMLLLPCD
jgi:hypothetical protein